MIRQLSHAQAPAWAADLRLSPPREAELAALTEETDPELRGLGLLGLADRLVRDGRLPEAVEIYQAILQSGDPGEHQARARQWLATLRGQGGFGAKFEIFLDHFAAQSLDPLALASMALGGTAFRLARLGALRAGASRLVAATLAWGTEVATFTAGSRLGAQWLGREHPNSFAQDLASSALILGSLRLSAWAGNSLAVRLAGTNPKLLPLAVQFTGITLGQGLEQRFGLRPAQGAGGLLADGLMTLFHFRVAGHLAQRMLGEKFSQWERRLDLEAARLAAGGPPQAPFLPSAGLAAAGGPPAPELPEALRYYSFSSRRGWETPPPQTRAQALRERFLPLFPASEAATRSEEIVKAVCRIHCELPDFHERLLEALIRAPRPGSLEQLYQVLAIEDVFTSDALRTATGSFDYALLQLVLGRAVSESDGPARDQLLQTIFRGMESGFSRDHWMHLAERLGYKIEPSFATQPVYTDAFWRAHSAEAGAAWRHYRPQDRIALFNFAYQHAASSPALASRIIQTFGAGRMDPHYSAAEFDAAMDYARNISHGELVLRRLHDIFAVQDSPSKLAELTRAPGSSLSMSQLLTQLRQGRSHESLAFEINGSAHTAYFNDIRLARKVLSVLEDIAPYLQDGSLLEANKARLVQDFKQWAALGRPLEVADLFKFLETNTNPVTEAFTLAWMAKQFDVELVAPAEFDLRVAAWGKTQDCDLSIFFPRGGADGRPVILVKETPALDLSDEAGRNRAFSELMKRTKALAHEAEHWRHITGNFFGTERASQALQLADVSREERYISELMANLEEFRWRIRNLDRDFWEISRRLGEPLVVYLRGMADRSYFGASNQTKALR